jgi:hypothetical protein
MRLSHFSNWPTFDTAYTTTAAEPISD